MLFQSLANWGMVGLVVLFLSLPYLLSVLPILSSFMVLIGAICAAITGGMLFTYLMEIIPSVAAGEDRLPEFSEYQTSARGYREVDLSDTVFTGIVTFLWSLLVPLSPWLLWLIFGGHAGFSATTETAIAWTLAIAGVCLIPITFIAVSWGGVGMVFRIDVLLRGACAAPLAYLSLVVMLAATCAVTAVLLTVRVPPQLIPKWLMNYLGGGSPVYAYLRTIRVGDIPVLLELITVYALVVMAVLLGLFQRYFGVGLPWGLEATERDFVSASEHDAATDPEVL